MATNSFLQNISIRDSTSSSFQAEQNSFSCEFSPAAMLKSTALLTPELHGFLVRMRSKRSLSKLTSPSYPASSFPLISGRERTTRVARFVKPACAVRKRRLEIRDQKAVYTTEKVGSGPVKKAVRTHNVCKEMLDFLQGHRRLWPCRNPAFLCKRYGSVPHF